MTSGFLVASMTFGGGPVLASDNDVLDPIADDDLTVEDASVDQQIEEGSRESPPEEEVWEEESLTVLAEPDPVEEPGPADEPDVTEDPAPADEPEKAVEKTPHEQGATSDEPAVQEGTEPVPPAESSRIPAEFETIQPPGDPEVVEDPERGDAFVPGAATVTATPQPNPDIPQKCGINVAIVLDMSSSLDSNDIQASRTAARGVVNALEGSPSQVGVYYFGTQGHTAIGRTSVSTAGGANTVRAAIDNVGRPSSGINYTNWDDALQEVVDDGAIYDVVLFVTDGEPNRRGNGSSSVPTSVAVDAAVQTANVLKGMGTAIIGIGVAGANANNIRQISGYEPADYYGVANYSQLAKFLQDLAEGNCRGTISVIKQVKDLDGNLTAAGGWEFSATSSTPGTTFTPSNGTTDPATGGINFDVFHATADTVNVSIVETPQDGYALMQQDGFNAVCTDQSGSSAPIPVTNDGANGFTLEAGRTQIVSCSVINEEVYEPVDLEVEKTVSASYEVDYDWTLTKEAREDRFKVPAGENVAATYDVVVTPSDPIIHNADVTGAITVTNPNTHGDPIQASITDASNLPGSVCLIEGSNTHVVTLNPGQTVKVDYSCDDVALSDVNGDYSNTVTVNWGGNESVTETVSFGFVEGTVTNDSVVVTDSEYDLTSYDDGTVVGNVVGASDGPTTFTYELDWPSVDGQCTEYGNTATGTFTSNKEDISSTEVVTVCGGADLEITKNVVHSFDRSYNWDLTKTVLDDGPFIADPVTGEVTVNYRITVNQEGYVDSGWLMSGTIEVENPNDWQDIPVTVLDEADLGAGVQCTVTGVTGNTAITDDDPNTPGFQTTIMAGQTMSFNYDCEFASQPDYTGTNTAIVEWDGDAASTPSSSDSYEVDVTEGNWGVDPINNSATITDSHYTFLTDWNVGAGAGEVSRDYELTWTVPEAGTCVEFTNTATLTGSSELILTDSETIDACRTAEVTVDKSVTAEFDRQHYWTIDKGLPGDDPFGQFVDEEGNAYYDYEVTVEHDGYEDSNWSMNGEITVTNPNNFAPAVVTVSDTTTINDAVCTVDPSVDIDSSTDGIQISVPANGSVTVDYDCELPAMAENEYDDHTNTATVTMSDGRTITSDPVDVAFTIGNEIDGTVDVVDDKTDSANPVVLGTVSHDDVLREVFEYELTLTSPAGVCTEYVNTAWVDVTGDRPEAEYTVIVCGQTDLSVFSTLDASYDRAFDWDVEKSAEQTRFEVAGDGMVTAEYTVVATASEPTDTNKVVTGMVRTTNPNAGTGDVDPIDIEATLSGSISLAGSVCTLDVTDVNDTEPGIQVLVPGGGVVEIPYSCTVPADADVDATYTNTVELSWGDGESVTFADTFTFEAETVTNDEVDVTDTMVGRTPEVKNLGTALASNSPVTFTYTEELPATAGQCVTYTNTAMVTQAQATDEVSVEVCAGLDLEISKNVIHSFDRTYLWDIDKSADATEYLVDPETGVATANYTVTVTPRSAPDQWEDSGWLMSGEITVDNPNDWLDIDATVTDAVDIGGGAVCTVTGGEVTIPAGESIVLDYNCTFDTQPDYSGTNTATVTWSGNYPTPGTSATGTADFDVDDWSMELFNSEISVFDDKTDPVNPVELGTATWNAAGTPGTFTYSVELDGVPGTCVEYTNTAWIFETGQEADVITSVCERADVVVSKTADATFDRTYLWDIEKTASETELEVDSVTGEGTFSYVIAALPNGYSDSGWAMSGEITVENPNDFESITVDVTDAVNVGGGAECTVIEGANIVIDAGNSATFAYDCTFETQPDYEGVNMATVSTDIGDFTGQVDVDFRLDGETDRTVNVHDDKTDPANPVELGTATWNNDGVAEVFEYDITKIGIPGQCVDYTNTAWIDAAGDNPEASLVTTLCVDLELEVEKTVTATYDRDYHWEIDKSVDNERLVVDEETGSAVFSYVVEAIPTSYTDSGWEMSGEISVTNPNLHHPVTATVTDITDLPGATCVVADGEDAVIPADSTSVFTYDCSFTEEPFYEGQNVAVVTSNDETFTGRANVDFEADVETDKTVTVMDDKTDPANPVELGVAEWNSEGMPVEFSYDLTLEGLAGQCVTFENNAWLDIYSEANDTDFSLPTAIIAAVTDENDPAASQNVELCVEVDLGLVGDAAASFDRTYLWGIDKSVDDSDIKVISGTSAVAHYVVAVTPDGFEDSNHNLAGTVTLTNGNDFADRVVTLEQTVSFENLTCEVLIEDADPETDGIQVPVPAMVDGTPGTVVIDYVCAGEPDTYDGTVAVTAAYLDGNDNDSSINHVEDVEYVIDEEINKTITVMDDKTQPTGDPVIIGTADWNDEGIATEFDYALELQATVGETVSYTNTAWIAETEQSDTETVKVTADKPVSPIKPPAPKPPAQPTPPPALPRTGVEGSGWLLALGATALLLGGSLVFGTNRRHNDS